MTEVNFLKREAELERLVKPGKPVNYWDDVDNRLKEVQNEDEGVGFVL